MKIQQENIREYPKICEICKHFLSWTIPVIRYMHTYIHTYMHTYICIHIIIYIHAYIHAVHTYIHAYIVTKQLFGEIGQLRWVAILWMCGCVIMQDRIQWMLCCRAILPSCSSVLSCSTLFHFSCQATLSWHVSTWR